MKRLLCVLLILCVLPVCVLSESIDLSSISTDDLVSLRDRITNEINSRLHKITLNAGIYQVGVDIPEGRYVMRCGQSEYGFIVVAYDGKLNESETGIYMPCDFYGSIYETADESHISEQGIKLIDGYYIEIKHGQVILYAKGTETQTN